MLSYYFFFHFPQRETDEYSSCFDGSDSALSSHLTKEELEHYTRIYEEKSTFQISLTEKVVPSHQHQTSYAQSEGYHSYVSSTDSTSTPFLDRYLYKSYLTASRKQKNNILKSLLGSKIIV